MRMRILASAAALAALAFAQTAAAATVTVAPIAFAPEFETKLDDEIGRSEGAYLQREVTKIVTAELERAGAQIGAGGDISVDVTIVDADPNRPTMLELRNRPGLDWGRSFSIGGAELHGVVRRANGDVIATIDHEYYTPNLEDVAVPAGEWSDAYRAIRMFADKLADAYAANVGE